MVSLMIKEVKNQTRIPPVGRNSFGVVVAENEIQITFGQLGYPVNDLLV
jgi:hypothetical protein